MSLHQIRQIPGKEIPKIRRAGEPLEEGTTVLGEFEATTREEQILWHDKIGGDVRFKLAGLFSFLRAGGSTQSVINVNKLLASFIPKIAAIAQPAPSPDETADAEAMMQVAAEAEPGVPEPDPEDNGELEGPGVVELDEVAEGPGEVVITDDADAEAANFLLGGDQADVETDPFPESEERNPFADLDGGGKKKPRR